MAKGFLNVLTLSMVLAATAPAQPPKASLGGEWTFRFADGSRGRMVVDKEAFTLALPEGIELKGSLELRGTYFESILSRPKGIHFIWGYLKPEGLEGKLQEPKPGAELKRVFKSGVVELKSTCEMAFTATRK